MDISTVKLSPLSEEQLNFDLFALCLLSVWKILSNKKREHGESFSLVCKCLTKQINALIRSNSARNESAFVL